MFWEFRIGYAFRVCQFNEPPKHRSPETAWRKKGTQRAALIFDYLRFMTSVRPISDRRKTINGHIETHLRAGMRDTRLIYSVLKGEYNKFRCDGIKCNTSPAAAKWQKSKVIANWEREREWNWNSNLGPGAVWQPFWALCKIECFSSI